MDLRNSPMMCHRWELDEVFKSDQLSQVIGYEDESIEIYFKDRSNLQLSSCGANFRYTRPHNGFVPSLGKKQFEVTQRCVFTTSETRQKVVTGLSLRNQLCSHPYFADEFESEMLTMPIRGYMQATAIKWPQSSDTVSVNDDGSMALCSLKGEAMLVLHPCKHIAMVYYNVPLQRQSCMSNTNDDPSSPASTTNRSWCAVQKRIFPASMCPPEWAVPLRLIQNVALGVNLPTTKLNYAEMAPQCAPRKCPNQFRHLWRAIESKADDPDIAQLQEIPEFPDTRIKFLWCEGNMYWIHNDGEFPKVETWLKNGDIFKSHPKNERYFVHLQSTRTSTSDKVKYVERIMSSAFIPNDTLLKSVMLRCIRMISFKLRSMASAKRDNPCWSVPSKVNKTHDVANYLPNFNAKVDIPSLGVFSAIADSIEICFNDGTMVHMNVTIDDRTRTEGGLRFIGKKCRIVLKDGQYFHIDDLSCSPLRTQSYVNHISAWIHWLSLPSLERIEYPFYSGTMYDQSQMQRVQRELEKINRATNRDSNFQYSESPQLPLTPISTNDVTEALSHTSKAIGDIDAIINQIKKLS